MDGMTSDILRIGTIKAVGDVVHIFSHIKKTYRVQWVILEGGEDGPPELHEELCLSPVPTPKSDKRGDALILQERQKFKVIQRHCHHMLGTLRRG